MYNRKDKNRSRKRGLRNGRARIVSWPAHSRELFSVKPKQLRDVRARKTSVFQTMLHGLAKLFRGETGARGGGIDHTACPEPPGQRTLKRQNEAHEGAWRRETLL